jgi:hypothetical protein
MVNGMVYRKVSILRNVSLFRRKGHETLEGPAVGVICDGGANSGGTSNAPEHVNCSAPNCAVTAVAERRETRKAEDA